MTAYGICKKVSRENGQRHDNEPEEIAIHAIVCKRVKNIIVW